MNVRTTIDYVAAKSSVHAVLLLGITVILAIYKGVTEFGTPRNDVEVTVPKLLFGLLVTGLALFTLWWNSTMGPLKHVLISLMVLDTLRDNYNLIMDQTTGLYQTLYGYEATLVNLGWLVAIAMLFFTRRPEASPRRAAPPQVATE